MGVLRCNTWLFGIALCTGCLQGKDTVLQPDKSDSQQAGSTGQSDQGVSSAGSKAPQNPGMSTGGNKPPSSAAGSGTGSAGSGGTNANVDAGDEGYENAGSAGSGGNPAAGSGGSVDAGMPPLDASAGPTETLGAADADCDFNGIWIANQLTVSEALSLPQTSNNWYYLELKQSGNDVEVAKHYDCGIEVRGSATVTLSRSTLTASITRNLQAGRKISVSKQGATCSFDAARFWSIRGADELRFLPGEPNPGRDFPDNISDVAKSKPLPTSSKSDGAIDIDNDGKLGIAFQVTGIVAGTRNSVQRDWTRWVTEPGSEIAAGQDWTTDLTIRADFDNEESIIDPTSGLLVSGSMPSGTAKHVLKLRFLGRDASDPRATAVIQGTEVDTCYAIQDALPAEQL